MVARALGVSFRQALRSVALTLFPLAFIALFAWASAGSTSGNTSDPVRASAWLYLGVHLVPFSLPSGKLTILPLLAVAYPMWAIRRGLPTVESAFSKLNGARLFYALWYAALSELLALISIHHHVIPNLIVTPTFTFLIAMIATAPYNPERLQAFYFALYLLAISLGVATLFYAWGLYQHWGEMKNIAVILSPGIVGGILSVAIQLLYLPNIAIMGLAYLTGIGFQFGVGSSISATHLRLGEIPALGALSPIPTNLHPALRYAAISWLFVFIILFIFIQRRYLGLAKQIQSSMVQGVQLFIVVGVIAYLSAGELMTSYLNPVGVVWWRFVEYLALAYLLAMVLTILIPAGIRSLMHRE